MGEVAAHGKLSAPEPLHRDHDLSAFTCGEAALDDWLRRRARHNQEAGVSRTYIVRCGTRVAGYYALAVGAVDHAAAPGRIRRNMPNPVPVMVIGRLAVDAAFHGRGIGAALLRDAILRTLQAAEIAGIRAILVHAISDTAKHFYVKHGFVESPIEPMTLMITVAEAAALLAERV